MKLRIDFYKSNSSLFQLALKLCRQVPTYKEVGEGVTKKYCVEFDNYTDEFEHILTLCASWKTACFYMNNKPVRSHQMRRYFEDPEYHDKMKHFYYTGDEILREIKGK